MDPDPVEQPNARINVNETEPRETAVKAKKTDLPTDANVKKEIENRPKLTSETRDKVLDVLNTIGRIFVGPPAFLLTTVVAVPLWLPIMPFSAIIGGIVAAAKGKSGEDIIDEVIKSLGFGIPTFIPAKILEWSLSKENYDADHIRDELPDWIHDLFRMKNT